jgi:segregation and condensation protein B
MAKKKAAVKEVERKVLSNGVILIKYDDGSYALLTPISADDAEDIFGGEAEDSEDEDDDEDEDESDDEDSDEDEDEEDSDDESDEDGDEEDGDEDEDEEEDDEDEDEEEDGVTPEDLAGMDFEALEDLCDDKELETDPDEFDEEDVEKLRKAIAKELGITLPKAKADSKKDTKKKKK